jgi:hypothetical protein
MIDHIMDVTSNTWSTCGSLLSLARAARSGTRCQMTEHNESVTDARGTVLVSKRSHEHVAPRLVG